MLAKFPLKIAFLLTLVPLIFFSSWLLFFMAPYLVVSFYNRSRYVCLWHALGCGLLVDLLSGNALFGITSVTYCLVTYFLYPQIQNFFEDKLSTLPIMSALFAFLSTALSIFLFFVFGHPQPVHFRTLTTDLLIVPILDASFAFFWFALPFQFYLQLVRLIKRRRAHATFRKRARSQH